MSHDALVRLLESRDLDGVRAVIGAQPGLLHEAFPQNLAPEDLGRGQAGNTPLHLAAYFGGRAIMKYLIGKGASLDARNAEHRTPSHVALEHNFEAIKDLEQLGIEKDHIHAACRHDHERLREILLTEPDSASDMSTGLSVLGWATYYGAKESAEILFEHGAQPCGRELHCAAGIANPDFGALLIDRGADVNEADGDGATPLHVAVAHQYSSDATDFVRLLLERGADREIQATARPLTPLQHARERLAKQQKAGIEAGRPRWKNFAGVIALLERD